MHIGGDSRAGLAHSAGVTAANVHDKHPLPELLYGNKQRVCKRKDDEIDEVKRSKNHNKSKVRARMQHVFAMVKQLWGLAKVRYQGLAKNATRSLVVMGLANIYLARQHLVAWVHPQWTPRAFDDPE